MKIAYLIPILAFTACITPDEVTPEPAHEFEVWQCFDPDDLKICYSLSLPSPGYSLHIEGDGYDYEITSGDMGCELNSATVFRGHVRITLTAEGIKETKTLKISEDLE